MSPKIYVVAGPNGIGKTTSTFDLLPKNIPIINSDEIAALMRNAGTSQTNIQELSNREAVNLMNKYLSQGETFAVETNLADLDTWKFLIEIQKIGYHIELIYLSTDHIKILNSRIEQRTLSGEHYVRPDIVEERYTNSLSLLNHYLPVPEVVFLFDNSESLKMIAEIQRGEVISFKKPLPGWVKNNLSDHFNKNLISEKKNVSEMEFLDEVRKAYEKLKSTDENSPEDLISKKQNQKIKKDKGPHL